MHAKFDAAIILKCETATRHLHYAQIIHGTLHALWLLFVRHVCCFRQTKIIVFAWRWWMPISMHPLNCTFLMQQSFGKPHLRIVLKAVLLFRKRKKTVRTTKWCVFCGTLFGFEGGKQFPIVGLWDANEYAYVRPSHARTTFRGLLKLFDGFKFKAVHHSAAHIRVLRC